MSYAWAIIKEFDFENSELFKDVEIIGPRHPKFSKDKIINEGSKFRLYDDDGVLYYEGHIFGDDTVNGFEPLDDFGMPNDGCTTFKYFVDGIWKTL